MYHFRFGSGINLALLSAGTSILDVNNSTRVFVSEMLTRQPDSIRIPGRKTEPQGK